MTHPDYLFGRLGNRMFQMAYLYAQFCENKILDMFVQDPKYFDKYTEEIKTLFGKDIGYLTQVSIHVRRGDYVGNSFYVDLMETDYYQKAIELFPNKNFLVFSDDPAWCKEQEIFKNKDRFQVMDRTTEVEDMNLMASCESNIIANSSFSWWAAFINPNWGKKIVAPKKWYSDGIKRTHFPKEWIVI